MGRGRKARTAAPTVVGATPATEDQPFVISMQQRQSAQDAAGDMDTAGRTRQPAKLKPTSFFTVPPRTEVLEKDDDGGEKDMFKRRADAPANLGEISGSKCCLKASTPCLGPVPHSTPSYRSACLDILMPPGRPPRNLRSHADSSQQAP